MAILNLNAPRIQPTYYGYNPPFWVGNRIYYHYKTDERLIKNDIMQLILTRPGERVYNPGFGTIVRAILFEPLTAATAIQVQLNVQQQISLYEERVTVNSVNVTQNADYSLLTIAVNVSPNFNPAVNYLVEVNIPTNH